MAQWDLRLAHVQVMLCRTFVLNRERAVDYLNMLERIYVFDGYAGWDPEVCPAPSGHLWNALSSHHAGHLIETHSGLEKQLLALLLLPCLEHFVTNEFIGVMNAAFSGRDAHMLSAAKRS